MMLAQNSSASWRKLLAIVHPTTITGKDQLCGSKHSLAGKSTKIGPSRFHFNKSITERLESLTRHAGACQFWKLTKS